jgi:hypothetical protein
MVAYRLAVTLGYVDMHECKCPGISLCIKAPSQAAGNAMLNAARLTKTEELAVDVTVHKGAARWSAGLACDLGYLSRPVGFSGAGGQRGDCEPALASLRGDAVLIPRRVFVDNVAGKVLVSGRCCALFASF